MADEKRPGKLVIISGFSGVGKGTVVRKLLENFGQYVLSVSMTTRKPREGEKDGVNYYFVTNEKFENMIEKDGFLEHARYADHYYGTPMDFVIRSTKEGKNVILEIEVQGAMQIKEKYPDAVLIFVTTPSAMEMAKRLIGRKTETHEQILSRFKRAVEEAEQMKNYDFIVINDNLDDCVKEVNRIVENNEGGVRYDPQYKKEFISDLQKIIKKHTEEAGKRAMEQIASVIKDKGKNNA
ncbi:MAG: guanylate kinase [Lachnospiraceae bacterium]|nr:guanylate kinase [Lachnospiraceae bacterium]